MDDIIRLLIADDHPLMLDGIAALLQNEPTLEVVALANNGQEALEKTIKENPNIVLMDIGMPLMDGLQTTRELQKVKPEVQVLILTMHDEPELILRVMQAGAAGYVLKDIMADKLIDALHAVHKGLKIFPALDYVPDTKDCLTTREKEILVLLVKGTKSGGNTNKDIARELKLSIRTVETHRNNIYLKLGHRTPLELVKHAKQFNLI